MSKNGTASKDIAWTARETTQGGWGVEEGAGGVGGGGGQGGWWGRCEREDTVVSVSCSPQAERGQKASLNKG